MHFISVIKIIHSMKTSFHSGAKGHAVALTVCRPLLSAETQGPQVGLHKGDSSRAPKPRAQPRHRGHSHAWAWVCTETTSPGTRCPRTGAGGPASREGKGCRPWAHPGAQGRRRPSPCREGAECRGATLRQGEAGSRLRCSLWALTWALGQLDFTKPQ